MKSKNTRKRSRHRPAAVLPVAAAVPADSSTSGSSSGSSSAKKTYDDVFSRQYDRKRIQKELREFYKFTHDPKILKEFDVAYDVAYDDADDADDAYLEHRNTGTGSGNANSYALPTALPTALRTATVGTTVGAGNVKSRLRSSLENITNIHRNSAASSKQQNKKNKNSNNNPRKSKYPQQAAQDASYQYANTHTHTHTHAYTHTHDEDLFYEPNEEFDLAFDQIVEETTTTKTTDEQSILHRSNAAVATVGAVEGDEGKYYENEMYYDVDEFSIVQPPIQEVNASASSPSPSQHQNNYIGTTSDSNNKNSISEPLHRTKKINYDFNYSIQQSQIIRDLQNQAKKQQKYHQDQGKGQNQKQKQNQNDGEEEEGEEENDVPTDLQQVSMISMDWINDIQNDNDDHHLQQQQDQNHDNDDAPPDLQASMVSMDWLPKNSTRDLRDHNANTPSRKNLKSGAASITAESQISYDETSVTPSIIFFLNANKNELRKDGLSIAGVDTECSVSMSQSPPSIRQKRHRFAKHIRSSIGSCGMTGTGSDTGTGLVHTSNSSCASPSTPGVGRRGHAHQHQNNSTRLSGSFDTMTSDADETDTTRGHSRSSSRFTTDSPKILELREKKRTIERVHETITQCFPTIIELDKVEVVSVGSINNNDDDDDSNIGDFHEGRSMI